MRILLDSKFHTFPMKAFSKRTPSIYDCPLADIIATFLKLSQNKPCLFYLKFMPPFNKHCFIFLIPTWNSVTDSFLNLNEDLSFPRHPPTLQILPDTGIELDNHFGTTSIDRTDLIRVTETIIYHVGYWKEIA